MALDADSMKRYVQDHLQEGLLLVVGSGLSAAEGIPGMYALSVHLKASVPTRLTGHNLTEWHSVEKELNSGFDLESAMLNVTLSETTVEVIVQETAKHIRDKERLVIQDVISGRKVLPFSQLASHLIKGSRRFHLITPNYDRLIELAIESSGIGVNTRFCGSIFGTADSRRAADAHREAYLSGRNASFRDMPHFCVHKPHGSLDWYELNGRVVRCLVPIDNTPVIITPGASKYRASFRWAFDDQRNAGNRAFANSTRLMFIGYGFNDDHLEQHICPGLVLKKPSVIVTKELTSNATKVIERSKDVLVVALSSVSDTDQRTRVFSSEGDDFIMDESLWNLSGFNKGIIR